MDKITKPSEPLLRTMIPADSLGLVSYKGTT